VKDGNRKGELQQDALANQYPVNGSAVGTREGENADNKAESCQDA
jgi:hypothetical protein